MVIHEDDEYIMSLAAIWSTVPEVLNNINQCQYDLQVTTRAEISDTTGTILLEHIVYPAITNVNQFFMMSTSTIKWPIQVNPSSQVWKSWTMFLRSLVRPTMNTVLKNIWDYGFTLIRRNDNGYIFRM